MHDDDYGCRVESGVLERKADAKIDHGYDRTAQIDDAENIVGRIRHARYGIPAFDLLDAQNIDGILLASEEEAQILLRGDTTARCNRCKRFGRALQGQLLFIHAALPMWVD